MKRYKFNPKSIQDKNFKLLVAMKEQVIGDSLKTIFDKTYDVQSVNTIDELIESVKDVGPEILLIDYLFKEGGGIDYLEQIKEVNPDSVIVVVSRTKVLDEVIKGINEGLIYYYVEKPVNVENLKNIVHRAAIEVGYEIEQRRLHDTITKQYEMLRKHNEALEKISQAKTTYIEKFVRHIKSPIARIGDLCSPYLDNEDVLDIFDAVQEIRTYIGNASVIGKIETKQLDVSPNSFSYDDMVQSFERDLRPFVKHKSLNISLSRTGSSDQLKADPKLLKLVCHNILGNIVRLTESGSDISVQVDIHDTEFSLIIEAPKLPIEELFRSPSPDSTENSRFINYKFGVSITHELVEYLGGSCEVENKTKTRYKITLPQAQV